MARIYTKAGDSGETTIGEGRCLRKDSPLIDVLGELDELSSLMGVVRTLISGQTLPELNQVYQDLRATQEDLFHIGAILVGSDKGFALEQRTAWLERQVDVLSCELIDLGEFVFPMGHLISVHLFLTRAVCRRAERSYTRFIYHSDRTEAAPLARKIGPYLNRLSDYLFVLARWVNLKGNIKEEKWRLFKSSKNA